MKRATEDRTKIRDARLSIKLSRTEKDSLEDYANKRGLTMSAMARMIIADYLSERG